MPSPGDFPLAYLQTTYAEFRDFDIHWIAPALGVRESRRIVGQYVLTENDLLAGYAKQTHPDIITVADHAMDTHGAGTGRAGCGEAQAALRRTVSVPDPEGFQNLLIACRAASFSSLAASSCRLSRTMLALGQAAGTAAATARRLGVSLPDVPRKPCVRSCAGSASRSSGRCRWRSSVIWCRMCCYELRGSNGFSPAVSFPRKLV